MAAEALDLSDPGVRVYPTPAAHHCGRCVFRAPCLVVNEGEEPASILGAAYRRRPAAEEGVGPRIGSLVLNRSRLGRRARFGLLSRRRRRLSSVSRTSLMCR